MLDSHKIYLYDRIKETSYILGTQDFVLNGAVGGFSAFGSVYDDGDNLFYAATDGTHYEVGSGVYVSGVQNIIRRYPFRSSNNNQKISFGEGIKEVFATYPATHAVYTASGLQNQTEPQEKGLAFWSSSNILNYDANLIWDSGLKRLGIQKSLPVYAIDVGGIPSESIIRASGFAIGSSGIMFPFANNGDSEYEGGVQLTHYEANELNIDTGIDEIIELSGNAKNHFLLRQQNAGFVFAGPVSGCTPPCSPDYPNFRPLFIKDIGELDGLSVKPLFDVPSKDGFRFDNPIAIATVPRDNSRLYIYNENDSNKNAAWFSSITRSTSSNIKQADYCFIASSMHSVASGVNSASGIMTAGSFFSLRNNLVGDAGTLSGIYGIFIGYGNDSGNFPDQNPITKNAYGLFVSPYDGSGTLQQAYDVYLADALIGSGIIEKHYGIYQEGNEKINVFQGKAGFNCVPTSGMVCSFNNSFDASTSGGWLNSAYASSGVYGGAISLLDTINVNPSSHYGYAIYTTEQGINLNFDMGNRFGESNPVLRLFIPDQDSLNEASMVFFGNRLSVRNSKTPASATASGIPGDICWDNNYIYVCVADNTWKRTYLSTW
jgi:hypothetical protein